MNPWTVIRFATLAVELVERLLRAVRRLKARAKARRKRKGKG